MFTGPKTGAAKAKRRLSLDERRMSRLIAHKRTQDQERQDTWQDLGLVWCRPGGSPIDARTDQGEWKAICREAGVRTPRVHDGRHTAATMLLLQGIDEQT